MTAAYIDAPFFHQAHLECCPMERHGETGEMDGCAPTLLPGLQLHHQPDRVRGRRLERHLISA